MPLRILFGTDQTLGLPVTSSTAVTATPNNHVTYFQPKIGGRRGRSRRRLGLRVG